MPSTFAPCTDWHRSDPGGAGFHKTDTSVVVPLNFGRPVGVDRPAINSKEEYQSWRTIRVPALGARSFVTPRLCYFGFNALHNTP